MYSQQVAKSHLENFCARCEKRFDSWVEYHAHVTVIRCAKKIVPLNTSGRTKMEIVRAWELVNLGVVIE